ncbi:MAG: hypothetical protein M1837_002439 [Sclerophora amabilis]|nr:MAG: hypothetical protein M1837_002439 [Sclerophora amabilis]
MADLGNFYNEVFGLDLPAHHHERQRGLLEDVFNKSGEEFEGLEPQQRLRYQELFHAILDATRTSELATRQGPFDPLELIKASYDQAIGERGKDSVLVTFFHFLTCDAVPTPAAPEQTSRTITSILSNSSRSTRGGKRLKAQGGTIRPVATPEGSRISEAHSHLGTAERLTELRKRCLDRDHHRCVVTRRFDHRICFERLKEDANAEDDDGIPLREIAERDFDALEVAHIIPHSMNTLSRESSEVSEQQRLMRSLLDMFDPGILREFQDNDIDRPRNAITLTYTKHRQFGDLRIFFEPTPTWTHERQEYVVKTIVPHFPHSPVTRVLLEHGREEMPSRRYLALHAACARICQLGGAAQYIEDIDDELEKGILRADGGTDVGALIAAQLLAGRTTRSIEAY